MRPSNQDAAFARVRGEVAVLAVADGMGGMPAGERASALAIAACEREPGADEQPAAYLRSRVEAAQRAVLAGAAQHPERAGMGSTLVLALVRGAQAWVAHAGDSRAYLWREGALRRLTEDHSAAGEAVRRGEITPAAALHDSRRHMLTRVVGGTGSAGGAGSTALEADPSGPHALDGDALLLLVTDGVCGVLGDEAIADAVAAHRGGAVARALVEAVHRSGAPDNIGIALLDMRS